MVFAKKGIILPKLFVQIASKKSTVPINVQSLKDSQKLVAVLATFMSTISAEKRLK